MDTVEELQAKQAEEMRELVMAHELAWAAPVPTKRVMFALKAQPWLIYEVTTLAEAVALARKFPWAPYVYARASCTHIQPLPHLSKNEGEWKSFLSNDDGAPYLELQNIDNHIHTAELECFTPTLHGKIAKVCIKIARPPAYISIEVFHDSHKYSRGTKDVRKTYPSLHEDKLVKWGHATGKDARATYIWFSGGGFNAAMDCLAPAAAEKGVTETA